MEAEHERRGLTKLEAWGPRFCAITKAFFQESTLLPLTLDNFSARRKMGRGYDHIAHPSYLGRPETGIIAVIRLVQILLEDYCIAFLDQNMR